MVALYGKRWSDQKWIALGDYFKSEDAREAATKHRKTGLYSIVHAK